MSNRFPPGHPLAAHPGLPPHPLDGMHGVFPHHLHHPQPHHVDPRHVPINSARGRGLPPSPVENAEVSLDGFSELPIQQPGFGVSEGDDFQGRKGKQIISPCEILTPYASRGSTVTLGVNNLAAASGAGPTAGAFLVPIYGAVPANKIQVAECRLGQDDCAAFSVVFEVTVPPQFATGYVVWEIQYGYGGASIVRNLWQQKGRIVVIGNFCKVSAYLILTRNPAIPPGQGDPKNNITAQASAMVVPCIDGQLRSTTAWAPFNTNSTKGFANLFPGACTLWRIGGFLSTTTGGSADFLACLNLPFTSTTVAPSNGVSMTDTGDLIVGEVAQGSTFSVDVSTSGFDFSNGLVLAASTTPNTLTLDTAAVIEGDCELLVN